jgi:hypothetical protein
MRRMLIALAAAVILIWAGTASAITQVSLGTAGNFAVLAGLTVTNTGSSLITGDLGLDPGSSVTGFPPGTLIGVQHISDAVSLQAQNDLTTAYNDAAVRTPVTTVATELGGTTLTSGVYNSASGTFGITGTLTLDGQNDPNAVWVFQMESTLITASSSHVVFVRGAQACNVFWQVGSSATLGTYSSFAGNILALTSITVTTGVVIEGRTLARNAAVTLDTDTITAAVCASVPCIPDQQVSLVPDNPAFPGPQTTQIVVPVHGSTNVPTVSFTPGCYDCGDSTCVPLTSWALGAWTFNPATASYAATLTAPDTALGCCLCIHLDYVLPVELLSFAGVSEDHAVKLVWTTASETSADRFEISRDGLNMATVAASNRATGSSYLWTDESAENGTTYRFDLVGVSLGGARQNLGSVMGTPNLQNGEVTSFDLRQNFPNPFNPVTSITLDLAANGNVSLIVYNVAGQEVANLLNGAMAKGRYVVSFDGSGLASGLYLYRLTAGGFVAEKKMLLMK